MNLHENSVLMRQEEGDEERCLYRVLWTNKGMVALFDLGDSTARPNWISLADVRRDLNDGLLSTVDDPFPVRASSSLTNAEIVGRDRRMGVIRSLVEDPHRGILFEESMWTLIKAQADKTGAAPDNILRLIRLWWKYGQLRNALVPNFNRRGHSADGNRRAGELKRGRPRGNLYKQDVPVGINVDDAVREHFKEGYELCKQNYSVPEAHFEIINKYYSEDAIVDGQSTSLWIDARPSLPQFRYWLNKSVSKPELLTAQIGEEAVARKHRQRSGNPAEIAFGPGSYFQIDATVANVHLLSRLVDARQIGRPFVYIITDIFSGMIVGFAVTLTVSWEGASAALENAFTDKVAFCKSHGIDITHDQWPSMHIPSNLDADRGGEVMSGYIGSVAKDLDFALNNMPPYRPDLKGFVENHFSILEKGWKHVPGAAEAPTRGDRRPITKTTYTLPEFVEWMIAYILKYNSSARVTRHHDGFPITERSPTPLELWSWGCDTFGTPRSLSRESVRKHLMCKSTCKESDKGLVFKRLYYVPVDGFENDMSFRFRHKKWRTFDHLHDPRDVSVIEVIKKGREDTIRFELAPRDRRYLGWTRDEVDTQHQIETAGKYSREKIELRAYSDFIDRTNAIEARQIAERRKPIATKRPKADSQARQLEKRAMQAEQARSKLREPDTKTLNATPAGSEDGEPSVVQPIPDELFENFDEVIFGE